MTDILDNTNVILQRDPAGALNVISSQFEQAQYDAVVKNATHDDREIESIVIAGMGGSALAALMVKTLLNQELPLPIEVVRTYDLPAYVGKNTLVVASSYSGNTEETLSALSQARERGSQIAIIASGGELINIAQSNDIAYVQLPSGAQPRMATIYNLRGLFAVLGAFKIVSDNFYKELSDISGWLKDEIANWTPNVPTENNFAKRLALRSVGTTPVIYGSPLTASLAYKWKISWNENAKNVAFCNEYPEFNHNEFMGWASHPVEKPYTVIDLRSSFDSARILQRFDLSDRLLSGKRPAAVPVELQGQSVLAQMVWGAILADFVSTYVAVLNNVDPTPVVLIEKLKQELASNPR